MNFKCWGLAPLVIMLMVGCSDDDTSDGSGSGGSLAAAGAAGSADDAGAAGSAGASGSNVDVDAGGVDDGVDGARDAG